MYEASYPVRPPSFFILRHNVGGVEALVALLRGGETKHDATLLSFKSDK